MLRGGADHAVLRAEAQRQVEVSKFRVRGPFVQAEFEAEPGVVWITGKNGAGKSQLLQGLTPSKNSNHTAVIDLREPDSSDGLPFTFQSGLVKVRSALSSLGQEALDLSKGEESTNSTMDAEGNIRTTKHQTSHHRIRGRRFESLDQLSDGTRWWIKLKDVGTTGPSQASGRRRVIVLIEEPERSLHPDAQRLLPRCLDEVRVNLRRRYQRADVWIFATTHSPFVLKGAVSRQQTVIRMEDCRVVKVSLAQDAVYGANAALGARLDDLLAAPILIAENSVVKLLEVLAKNLSLTLPLHAVSATGGDGEMEKQVAGLAEFFKLLAANQERYPHSELKLTLWAVCDDRRESERLSATGLFKDSDQGALRLFTLGEKQLEDAYPDPWVQQALVEEEAVTKTPWDRSILFNTFLRRENELRDKHENGKLKSRIAEKVGSRISTPLELHEHLPSVYRLFSEIFPGRFPSDSESS